MGRSFVAKSIAAFQKIRFEDRFQDKESRHLDYPISYRRDAQRPELAVGLFDPHTPYRLRLVLFLLQQLLDLVQKSPYTAFAVFDALHRNAIYSGAALIGLHPFPCRFQRIPPKNSAV